VTLSGTIQYETQRHAILKAAGALADVGQVIDQLNLQPQKRNW
jgi:hypothetical protein